MKNWRLLDFIILLMISVLIITASAAVYNYMYILASPIGVESPYINFLSGNDATSTIGQNDTYAKITDMAGWPNATRVYEDALRIQNPSGSDHNCELMFDSWSGDTSYVLYIYVKIFDTIGGSQKGSTLSVTAQNSTGTITVLTGDTDYIQWEIRWNGTAFSTHTVSVALKLKVP